MTVNLKFYKIKLLEQFLTDTAAERVKLLEELKINATDPVLYQRRVRMLSQLSRFEIQILEKINNFDTDNSEDFTLYGKLNIWFGMSAILHRSA